MALHFKTLGVPELLVAVDDTTACLRLRYRKAYAVLGYLAVERERWHERRRLADFFWPRLAPEAALANLRLVLKNLGDVFAGTIGTQCLRIERERLGLYVDTAFHADVLLLQEDHRDTLRRCTRHEDFTRLTAAWDPWLDQIEGEFLAGIDADDGGQFEDWLLLQRAACDRARAAFLREYLQAARRCGTADAALRAARAWVRCRPVDDDAAQAQMEALAAFDRPEAALDAHADFAQRLERLIGAVPQAATDALRQRIAAAVAPGTARNEAIAVPPTDEVRRVVVLQIEPDLGDEADALEPEALLAPIETALHAALSRWHGRPIPVSGPAFGAVFGLADDAEQAPRRALMAALEIAALPLFDRTRIGICEGKALVRPTARHPLAGSVLSALAQRLALCGAPGDVIVAASLAEEIGRYARSEPLARRRFVGLAGEHAPCRLVAATAAVAAYPAAFATPYVGRADERARLTAAIAATGSHGRAAFVEVVGAAGQGKSRLLAELARTHGAAGGEVRWIGHRPELRHVSLGALRETLRTPLQAFLTCTGESAEDITGRTLIDTLIALLFTPAKGKLPVLLVFDDLHWADEATRELLRIAVQSPPAAAVLAVLAGRPAAAALNDDPAIPRIVLQSLSLDESLALIAAIDADDSIGKARRTQLARMSGGLPLGAEYIARAARDQAVSDASLFGILQSVLDRLGPHKPVLQAAAVLGAAFRGDALRALLPQADAEAALRLAETLAIGSRTGEQTYAFHHALLRDCAYESIPPPQRRDWHRLAAAWLAQQADAAPADVAQHFEAAHAWPEACRYWRSAAETAYLAEFAGDAKEAAVRALAAAAKDDAPLPAADKAELELLAGFATLMAEGFGSRDAPRFFAPAAAAAPGEVPHETLVRALSGMVAAEPRSCPETLAIIDRFDRLARTPAHRMMVCYGRGAQTFWRGEFARALRCYDEAIDIGTTLRQREWLRYGSDDPVVACRALKGIGLAYCGTAVEALEMAARAVEDARRGGRMHGLCFALTLAASVHMVLDRPIDVERLAGEGLALAEQWNFPFWRAYNTMFDLWAKARQGRLRLRESFRLVSMHREFAAASRLSPVTALWFSACIFEALERWTLLEATVGRALTLAENGGDRYCMPDLLRQKALARHGRGDARGARRLLDEAQALAGTLGAFGLIPRISAAGRRIGDSASK